MYKKKIFLLIALLLLLTVLSMIFLYLVSPKKNAHIIMKVANAHNGDAKFYNDYIVTEVQGKLVIYDMKGNLVKSFSNINANWIYCMPQENYIIYANSDCQIGLLKVDDNFNIISNRIIMTTANMQIDPTMIKVQNTYYLTATEIQGKANNADINAENGIYTLHLFQSTDLTNWSLVQDVVTAKNNIEDVDMMYLNNKFYITYEKELVDKGNSSLNVATIDTMQANKTTITELLPADCDHEPASIKSTKNGFRIYYSCDKNYPGESYSGSQIFYSDYDTDWNSLSIDCPVQTQTQKGILLYEVKDGEHGKQDYLYSQDYLNEGNMIIEEQ